MHSIRNLVSVLTAGAVVMLGAVSAQASTDGDIEPTPDPYAYPTVSPDNAPPPEGYFDKDGNWVDFDDAAPPESNGLALENNIFMASCNQKPRGDYVHKSSGDASGHGWWTTNVASCSSVKLNVLVYLYQYYSDGKYYLEKTNSGERLPRNYGGGRVTTRANCDSSAVTGWISQIYVNGTDEKERTPNQNIACRVN
jgi:hypothetical protein